MELSNDLSEQMKRSTKINLNNAGNIGSEVSARHDAFMFSVIESRMIDKKAVENYLSGCLTSCIRPAMART